MERHGHEPKPKDIKVYNKNQQVASVREEAEELDEAGLGMKKFKRAFRGTGPEGTGDPRPMKKRLRDDPEHAKIIASKTGKLGGMAELQRRIAKKLTKEEFEISEATLNEKKIVVPAVGSKHKVDDEGSIQPHRVTSVSDGVVYTQHINNPKERLSIPLRDWAGSSSPMKDVHEAKDEREYGYEGDMAITQLKTICRNAEHLMKMMKPDTDLPEWVQSKITKAEDYISTAHDYLMSEMNEEALDEGGSQYRSAAGSGKNTNPNLSKLARKLAFEKPKSYRPHGTPSKAESKAFLDAEVDKFMKKGGKIKKEEVEELDEAKCNMTEAGKMCEVHGMKDCKKSSGKKLLLDKDIKEKTMTAAEKKKEESLKDKYDDSDMKEKMKKQYGDKKGEQVYFAYIRKQAMQESISDQRSSKRTSTEEARKEIYKAFLRKKERKEKMKEATTDTTNNYTVDGSNNLGFKL
jgi:hypothetical protein